MNKPCTCKHPQEKRLKPSAPTHCNDGAIIAIGNSVPIPLNALGNELQTGKQWVFRARGSKSCKTCMQYDGNIYFDLQDAPKLPLHPIVIVN